MVEAITQSFFKRKRGREGNTRSSREYRISAFLILEEQTPIKEKEKMPRSLPATYYPPKYKT